MRKKRSPKGARRMTPVKRTVKKKRGRSIKISRKKSRQTHRKGRPSGGIRKTKKKRGGADVGSEEEKIKNMRDMIMKYGIFLASKNISMTQM